MVPGKNDPRKIGPRKMSFKRMLWNLNSFYIFINWFHYTHKKIFDVHLRILHAPNCRTLKDSRKVCCRVLGFHILITSEHPTHTPRCSTLTPRLFVSEFSETIFPGIFSPGDHFSGTIFLSTIFVLFYCIILLWLFCVVCILSELYLSSA